MEDHPEIANKPEYHEMTPAEKSKWWYERLNYIWFKIPELRKEFFSPSSSFRIKWFFLF